MVPHSLNMKTSPLLGMEAGGWHLCAFLLPGSSQWAPSFFFLVYTIFGVSLCHTPEWQYLLEDSFNSFLVLQFLWLLPRGRPSSTEPGGRGSCIPGSHGTATIRDSFWQTTAPPPPQGTAQTADWNTPTVFLWKRPICLSWSLAWGAGFRFCTHIEAYGGALREHRLVEAIFAFSVTSLLLTRIAQKSV